MTMLSVIIVNYNERARLANVLGLLSAELSGQSHEIIVVDNASTDGSVGAIKSGWSEVVILEAGTNLMYGKGNNLGLTRATGDWILIMNADLDWTPGQLNAFIVSSQTLKAQGLTAPQLRTSDGRIQISAHRAFPSPWTVFIDYCLPLQQWFMRSGQHLYQDSIQAHQKNHAVAHITGACLMFPRTIYEKLGGFDERFTMYLEETEWQKRLADHNIPRWFIADSYLTHFGSAAKTFAQSSKHFLWGLELYTRLHWRGPARRARLLAAIWLGTIISDALLLITWPISFMIGPPGKRIRHYFQQYSKLTINLFSAPTTPPSP